MLILLLLVIVVALIFEFINGFHDTANSIATVVATKVLTPTQAVMLAAITNLVGAFSGTAVAKTISSTRSAHKRRVITHSRIGIPPRVASIFHGKRNDPMRA